MKQTQIPGTERKTASEIARSRSLVRQSLEASTRFFPRVIREFDDREDPLLYHTS